MEEKKKAYAEDGIDILVERDPFVIIILTPIMKRSHEQNWSSEICFVDTTGSCDQTATCVTFILGAHKIGGIPLACLLHSGQTEEIYRHAFLSLRKKLPNGFGGNGFPAVFMTDDSQAERKALSTVFPESHLLLCSFHVCQAFWRWLCEVKNCIDKSHRQSFMMAFRAILYATNEIDVELLYKTLLDDCKKYSLLVEYLKTYWLRRTEWCHFHRKHLLTRGHNTNNYVEASIRVFKDVILQRCKAFNSIALLEFVVKILESYHTRKMLNYANNRATRHDILYDKFKGSASKLQVQSINEEKYNVTSSTDSQVLYTVNFKDGFTCCDCFSGSGGAYCKHICAVEQNAGVLTESAPVLTPDDKVTLAYIALGTNTPKRNFFTFMRQNVNVEQSNVECDAGPLVDTPSVNMNMGVNNSADDGETVCFTPITNSLKSQFDRILGLTEKNINSDNQNIVVKFVKSLERITTVSQLINCYAMKTKTTRRIGVQPTSISRRKIHNSLSAGKRRIQSGRPSSKESSQKKKRTSVKRKHNLIGNIKKNVPNAKIH